MIFVRYEARADYDPNNHKIELVSNETKVITPEEFMNGSVKQLVATIRETDSV